MILSDQADTLMCCHRCWERKERTDSGQTSMWAGADVVQPPGPHRGIQDCLATI